MAIMPLWIDRRQGQANGAFLDDLQIHRQRTRTQGDGQLVRALDREAARNLALPPMIGSLMLGADKPCRPE
jgi:hypothetical protein